MPAVLAVALVVAGCARDEPAAPGEDGMPTLGEATLLDAPAGAGSGQPNLAAGPDGRVVLSWLEPAGEGHGLKAATLEDGGWSAARTVVSGDDLLANWADLPSVVPITAEVWAAHWLKTTPGSFASYDIAYALSGDGGQRFEGGELLNTDGALTEHGFVSLFPWGDAVGAVWLDGRRIAEQFERGDVDPAGPPVGVSLRFARIDYDGSVEARGEIDELVCDCCRTGAAVGTDGPVIVYRERSADEIRDVAVRRFADGGWQPPVVLGPDGWRIEGCPVNGPAIDADGEHVVVAWFTAEPGPRVRFARSLDAGASFEAPIEIDGEGAFGQVDIALLPGGDGAVVSWWRRAADGDGLELAVRRVARDGAVGAPHVVARNAVAQPLDVPGLAASGDRLVLAWTDAAEGRVRTAEVRVP